MKYKAILADTGKIEMVPNIYVRCIRCNRLLRTEEAKTRGYGTICWSKVKDIPQTRLF